MSEENKDNVKLLGVVILVFAACYFLINNNKKKEAEKEKKKYDSNAQTEELVVKVINADLPVTDMPQDNFSSVDGGEKKEVIEQEKIPDTDPVLVENKKQAKEAMEWFIANKFDTSKLKNISDSDLIDIANIFILIKLLSCK